MILKSHYWWGIFLLLKRPPSKDTLAVRGPIQHNTSKWNKKSGIKLLRFALRLRGGPGPGGGVALSDQRTCGSVFQRRGTEAPTLPPHLHLQGRSRWWNWGLLGSGRHLQWWTLPSHSVNVARLAQQFDLSLSLKSVMKKMSLWKWHWTDSR